MKVSVMGSGSWGTALAVLLCQNGHQVCLWSYQKAESEALRRDREHKAFLLHYGSLHPFPDPLYNCYDYNCRL